MNRFKSIAMILMVTIFAMGLTPADAEAKKPWWKIVGGLLATGGAVAAGLTGAGAAVVVPLCGVETGLLATAAGGGNDNGGGVPGGISDAQPFYSGPVLPEFCEDAAGCEALDAILGAQLRPLPLPGTSQTIDNLTRSVNALMTNPLKDHMIDGSGLDIVQADMLAMAEQLDETAFWFDAVEDEDPTNRIVFTPQMILEARDWMAVNGLPEEEVEIYLDAGLSMEQIDAIAAFHVEAMGDIDLVGPPVTIQDVLREAAASFRTMGSGHAGARELIAPTRFTLKRNSPNPFNPMTTIEYVVDRDGPLSIKVFNARGRYVKTLVEGHHPAGEATIAWSGTDHRGQDVPSGVYFCRIEGGGEASTLKMTLLK